MKILTKSTIESLYNMEDCLKDIEEAFLVNRNAETPVRTALAHTATNGTSLYMPAYSEALGYSAIKMVSVFPDNPKSGRPALRGAILLTDTTTGEHVALMDASYLTILRTGASSGVATKYLAKADAHTLSVIGTGAQAIGQILAVLAVRDIHTICLYNRTHEKANRFAQDMRGQLPSWNGEIIVAESAKAAVEVCDILVCSTKSDTPVFNGNDLKPGTHINGIGSFQASMQEVDVTTLKRSNKIVVDTIEGAQHEAGDLLIPAETGAWSFDELYSELSPILANETPGRENDEEITFYKSVGVAYLDTAVAVAVYKKAIEADVAKKLLCTINSKQNRDTPVNVPVLFSFYSQLVQLSGSLCNFFANLQCSRCRRRWCVANMERTFPRNDVEIIYELAVYRQSLSTNPTWSRNKVFFLNFRDQFLQILHK